MLWALRLLQRPVFLRRLADCDDLASEEGMGPIQGTGRVRLANDRLTEKDDNIGKIESFTQTFLATDAVTGTGQ